MAVDLFPTGRTRKLAPGEYDIVLNHATGLGLLTKEQEYALADIIQSGAPEAERLAARDKLVLHNVRAAVKIAKRFARMSHTAEDAMSCCMDGMLFAAERFSREKAGGGNFIAYAIWYMAQRNQVAMRYAHNYISMPHGVANLWPVAAIIDKEKDGGLSDDEIAEILVSRGKTENEARTAISGYRASGSFTTLDGTLDSRFGQGCEMDGLHNVVPDPSDRTGDDTDLDAGRIVAYAEKYLDPTHYAALMLRFFGGDGGDGLTLVDTGDVMSRTRERIRQICEEAVDTIRAKMARDQRNGTPPPERAKPDMERAYRIAKEIKHNGRVGRMTYCSVCGRAFNQGRGGTRHCSPRCSEKTDSRRVRVRSSDPPPMISMYCNNCGSKFSTRDPLDRYCSQSCKEKHNP